MFVIRRVITVFDDPYGEAPDNYGYYAGQLHQASADPMWTGQYTNAHVFDTMNAAQDKVLELQARCQIVRPHYFINYLVESHDTKDQEGSTYES